MPLYYYDNFPIIFLILFSCLYINIIINLILYMGSISLLLNLHILLLGRFPMLMNE